jgi:hypothetical protein
MRNSKDMYLEEWEFFTKFRSLKIVGEAKANILADYKRED